MNEDQNVYIRSFEFRRVYNIHFTTNSALSIYLRRIQPRNIKPTAQMLCNHTVLVSVPPGIYHCYMDKQGQCRKAVCQTFLPHDQQMDMNYTLYGLEYHP